jgi:putative sterol carrier protein
MSFVFPSPEWAAEFKRELSGSRAYQAAASTWTHGAVALVVKADPRIGVAEDLGVVLDLHRGQCRDVRVAGRTEAGEASFCIVGEYARWRAIIRRELEPIKALMQKKLELKGQMTILVRYVSASKELVECAARVPTRFLDET